MAGVNKQIDHWTGNFGREYILRHRFSVAQLDKMYERKFGVKRTVLNKEFIGRLNRSIRILEVGTNVGNQLLALQQMGFKDLYGIDVNPLAVHLAHKRLKGVNVICGSAFDIPFKDGFFDLVFTSGVLIHIKPANLAKVMAEVNRCSSKYIWGYEYYALDFKDVVYRGDKQFLWKGDYAALYQQCYPELKLLKERFLKYRNDDNVDHMFLLKKS